MIDNINFNNILKDFKRAWVKKLRATDHIASGHLMNDMDWKVEMDTRGWHITITLPEYAMYVDKGTKPHFPPVDKIKEWIEVKPVIPRPMSNGRLPSTEQLAFLIARKISKVGTKPTNVITDTINEFELKRRLAEKVDEEIRRYFEQEING